MGRAFVRAWVVIMGVLLLVVAAGSLLFAWGALGNLFGGYQDSSTSTYLSIGLPFLAIAILSGFGGVLSIRQAFKPGQ